MEQKSIGELTITIKADTSEFHRALGKVEGHLESIEAKIRRIQEQDDMLEKLRERGMGGVFR